MPAHSSRRLWWKRSTLLQDLVLSRLIVEIGNDENLSGELAIRGGTRADLVGSVVELVAGFPMGASSSHAPAVYDPLDVAARR